jgi:hypothetical protein
VLEKKIKRMKKVLALLLIALASYGSAYALDLNEYKVFYKLHNETTLKSLSRYLQLNGTQTEKLFIEFRQNETNIRQAIQETNVIAAEEAMNVHLNNMKMLLNDEQYNKFISALNATLEYNRETKYLAVAE